MVYLCESVLLVANYWCLLARFFGFYGGVGVPVVGAGGSQISKMQHRKSLGNTRNGED